MIDTTIIFFINLFLHIVDDFYLQGLFTDLKQKSWWEKQAPKEHYKEFMQKYGKDYYTALFLHGFSWAFMTNLVYLIMYVLNPENIALREFYIHSVFINAVFHASIDDLKANQFKINLAQDQFLHIIQILVSLIVYSSIQKGV